MSQEIKNLIHIYLDGDQWCAIYPMGSNLMDCQAVAFSPINVQYNEHIGRSRDYGRYKVLTKLKEENPTLPTHSFYTEHWD